MFAKYRNKTVKVLSKYYDGGYLILNNNPTKEEKVFTFTLRDALNIYGNRIIAKYNNLKYENNSECSFNNFLTVGNYVLDSNIRL